MKGKFRKKTQDYFLTGLIFILPFYFTFIFLRWILTFIHRVANGLPINILKTNWSFRLIFDFVFVISALILIVLFGYLLSLYFGKRFNSWLNRIMKNIPIVNSIYSAIKNLIDGLAVGSKKAFKKSLYVEYPLKGSWVMGFLTGEISLNGRKKLSVFVPTSPNPTSGFLLFVNKNQTKETGLSVEEAFRVIISGGIISPKKIKK